MSVAASPAAGEYVFFRLGAEQFALPMAVIEEIIRPPRLDPLPLSNPLYLGLANLRGRVLPVVDLRRTLGCTTGEQDAGQRVLVTRVQGVGLLVDQVDRVEQCPASAVQTATGLRTAVDHQEVLGVLDIGSGLTPILDLESLVSQRLTLDYTPPTARRQARAAGPALRADAVEDSAGQRLEELIVLQSAGQRFALPLQQVRELVPMPGACMAVPNAPDYLAGAMCFRQQIVPLLLVDRLFDLPRESEPQNRRVLVVPLSGRRDDDTSAMVGLVADQVDDVLRLPANRLVPLPEQFSALGGVEDCTALCRLDDGSLASVLDMPRFAATNMLQDMLERVEQLATDERDDEDSAEDVMQLLVLDVGKQAIAISISQVREIVRHTASIEPVPLAPSALLGVINLRGVALPVVDLADHLGLGRTPRSDGHYRIVVIGAGDQRLGLIVGGVRQVLRVGESALRPAPDRASRYRSLIQRVVLNEEAGADEAGMVLLLEALHLFRSGALGEHPAVGEVTA